MVERQLVDCPGFPRRHVCLGSVVELAIVVPAHCRQIEGHQAIRRSGRIERPGEAVAEVDDLIDAPSFNIGEDGIEGGDVAMDVAKCGKFNCYVPL